MQYDIHLAFQRDFDFSIQSKNAFISTFFSFCFNSLMILFLYENLW